MILSASDRGDTPASNDSIPVSCKPSPTITTIEPVSTKSGKAKGLRPTLRVILATLGESLIADFPNEVGVADSGDARHASETRGRRAVRICIHFEQPGTAGWVDAEIAAPVSFAADDAPSGAGDDGDLVGEIFREVGG